MPHPAPRQVCPRSAKVTLVAGMVAQRRGDPAKAIELFEEAHRIEPTFCDARYETGITMLQMGDK